MQYNGGQLENSTTREGDRERERERERERGGGGGEKEQFNAIWISGKYLDYNTERMTENTNVLVCSSIFVTQTV